MKFVTIIVYVLGIVLLSSCMRSSEVNNLQARNKELQNELVLLKKKLKKIELMPIVYPESEKILLGESYQAAFMVGVYGESIQPTITVYNREYPDKIDTLFYDKSNGACLLTIKPKEKGKYVYNANMKVAFLGDTLLFPIQWDFYVE
jgi:hypothetical protein